MHSAQDMNCSGFRQQRKSQPGTSRETDGIQRGASNQRAEEVMVEQQREKEKLWQLSGTEDMRKMLLKCIWCVCGLEW